MVARPLASGGLAADRRASYAEMLAQTGDPAAAAEVLSGALELAPGWAAGWYRLGEYFEAAGDPAQAAAAWDRVLALDPSDALGAGLKRSLLLDAPLAETMPAAFVELLFDQYAPRFETSLLERLDYRGPQILMQNLRRAGFARAARALDLGCGTGLMGQELRPHCGWLGGYDISAGMLAKAREKAVYDCLEKRDIGQLALGGGRFGLIVAADVFMYLGALERTIAWCAGSLAPGGMLAFTVELGSAPVELRQSRRFAHSPDYVQGLMRDSGFAKVETAPCVIRKDRGADIAALCVVAAGPGGAPDREGDAEIAELA